jgi:hypothetical protein
MADSQYIPLRPIYERLRISIQWRRDAYVSEREADEDVDLRGKVEFADPTKVVNYIRECYKLRLKAGDVRAAIGSISDCQLQDESPKSPCHVFGVTVNTIAREIKRMQADG